MFCFLKMALGFFRHRLTERCFASQWRRRLKGVISGKPWKPLFVSFNHAFTAYKASDSFFVFLILSCSVQVFSSIFLGTEVVNYIGTSFLPRTWAVVLLLRKKLCFHRRFRENYFASPYKRYSLLRKKLRYSSWKLSIFA